MRTFAEVLYNTCFHRREQIRARCASWEALFAHLCPDVIVCDHAPSALLAAQTTDARIIPLGTGYELPDCVDHFPDWRPELKTPPDDLLGVETSILNDMNAYLQARHRRPLEKISDIYHRTHGQLLATTPELDCYAPRLTNPRYFGLWPAEGGLTPEWANCGGRRVLAYLKPFSDLQPLLEELVRLATSSIVVCPGIEANLAARFHGTCVRVLERPVDLTQAAAQCDFAIGHGTHGFTAQLMLSGKPQLMIPQVLEQRLHAERIQFHRAGAIAYQRHPGEIVRKLRLLVEDDTFGMFAQRLSAACQQRSTLTIHDAISELVDDLPNSQPA